MSARPKEWWLAPEPVARDVLFLIRIRSRLIRARSRELAQRTRELRTVSTGILARSKKLVRRSRWLIESGRSLPHIVGREQRERTIRRHVAVVPRE
jgi:hypothetical protein